MKSTPRKEFGSKMKELRLERGLSQERLADLAGLDRTSIGATERGEQNVSVDNISKKAKALKIWTSVLFSYY